MSCAFCGMPPLDGEPCCTAEYRRDVMRRADRKIREQDAELCALRERLARAEATVRHYEDTLCLPEAPPYLHPDGAQAREISPVRIGDLVRRAEDVELIARLACAGGVLQRFDGGDWTFTFRSNRLHFTECSFHDDGTGLPVLTDEARARLRGEVKT